jgi:hypothetical protein
MRRGISEPPEENPAIPVRTCGCAAVFVRTFARKQAPCAGRTGLAFSMWRRGPRARGGIHKPEKPSRSQPARPCGSTQARPSKMPSIRRLRRRLPGRSLHHQRNPRCGSKRPLDVRRAGTATSSLAISRDASSGISRLAGAARCGQYCVHQITAGQSSWRFLIG